MEIGDLYQLVLLIVLVGLILGVGILVLDKFGGTSGVTSSANTSLQATATALGEISSDWLSLIITIAVLAIILTLVIRSFAIKR